jgi:hypothetical protein
MLTIFTVPKPFQGHNGIIQNNAIQSWLSLQPRPEIILCGDDEGTADAAVRLGARHIPDIELSKQGTPLLNSVFAKAQDSASNRLVCYINADIILLSDFLTAIGGIQMSSFLLAGQRWDADIKEPVDFTVPDWEAKIRERVFREGKIHPPTGIDYFVFSRGLYRDIPPLAIGRGGWDEWLVYKARTLRVPVIDATGVVTAIHQNHDYAHYATGEAGVWKGAESIRNIELMGGMGHAFTLEYATHLLTRKGLKKALTPRHIYFRIEAAPLISPRLRWLAGPMKGLTRLLVRLRSGFRGT